MPPASQLRTGQPANPSATEMCTAVVVANATMRRVTGRLGMVMLIDSRARGRGGLRPVNCSACAVLLR